MWPGRRRGCAPGCWRPVMTCGCWRPAGSRWRCRGGPGTGWGRWRCPPRAAGAVPPGGRRWGWSRVAAAARGRVSARSAAPAVAGAGLGRGRDGMPLAIELAARVEALGVAQLLDRIGDRFALLADGDRLAADRHRSLAATVQWSYQLLSERERRVFRVVSV